MGKEENLVQRYRNRIIGCPKCGEPVDEVDWHPEGDFVLFEDYEKLQGELAAANRRLPPFSDTGCQLCDTGCPVDSSRGLHYWAIVMGSEASGFVVRTQRCTGRHKEVTAP